MDNFQTTYIIDIDIPLLTKPEIKELYNDGRAVSPMLEKIIPKIFNITRVDGCGYDYLINDTNKRIELKTITKNGTKSSPSYMQGKSRVYNLEEHKKIINSNYGYLFIDVTRFPKLKIYFIKSCDDLLFKEKSYSVTTKLLNQKCTNIISSSRHIILN